MDARCLSSVQRHGSSLPFGLCGTRFGVLKHKTYDERLADLSCLAKVAGVLGCCEQITAEKPNASCSPDGDVVLRPGDVTARKCSCARGSSFAESISVDWWIHFFFSLLLEFSSVCICLPTCTQIVQESCMPAHIPVTFVRSAR